MDICYACYTKGKKGIWGSSFIWTHVESKDEDEDAHEDENANEVEEDNDVNHGEEHDPMIENVNDIMEHDEDIDIDVCAMRDLYLNET